MSERLVFQPWMKEIAKPAKQACLQSGAGVCKIVMRDDNGKAFRACIFTDGVESTEPILAVIAAEEQRWDDDDR